MLENRFTTKQKQDLSELDCVEKITSRMICFTKEFKCQAIKKRYKGEHANDIFSKAGIDLSLFPRGHFVRLLKDWDFKYKKGNYQTFNSKKRGRPQKKETINIKDMSKEEMQARIAYLEAENRFIKKLKALEEENF